MREIPCRKRVGREALVHHRERRDHRFVVQIAIVFADLMREQHPLVDNRARRKRRHEEFLSVAQIERLNRVSGTFADHIELALERVLVHVARSARHEHLLNHRLDFLRAQGKSDVVGRHLAPAKQYLAFRMDRAFDFLFACHP